MFRILPADPAALESLVAALETAERELDTFMGDVQSAYVAAVRRGQPLPPMPRPPGISLMVRSYMLEHSLACLRSGGDIGVNVALADMRELHRDARQALDALARQAPHAGPPAAPSPPDRASVRVDRTEAAADPAGSPGESGQAAADARASLEYLWSRFREGAGRHPGFRHVLIEAPHPAALPDVQAIPHAIGGGKTFAYKANAQIQVFIDGDVQRITAACDALGSLAGTAIGMLREHGIFHPAEPPPDPHAPSMHLPDDWMKTYWLREWLLFLHRQARERPDAPPGLQSVPYVGNLKLAEGAMAHALGCGVFEASALILGRLLAEATEQARQTPPAVPPVGPAGGVLTDTRNAALHDDTVAELTRYLEELEKPPPPFVPTGCASDAYYFNRQNAAHANGKINLREYIDRIRGIDRLSLICLDRGEEMNLPFVRRFVKSVVERTGLSVGEVKSLTVAEAVAYLEPSEPQTGPPADPPPSIGPTGRTEAPPPEGEPAAAGMNGTPREDRPAAGPARTPRGNRQAAADALASKVRTPGDPVSRAVAAAMSLQKNGKPVSVRKACSLAGVDRKHLAEKYPDAIELIEKLAEPDRKPPRGSIDRRTGNLDAWDDPEDD